MISFLLTSGVRCWYVVGAYEPPKYRSIVHRMEQALRATPRGLELILMADLNERLDGPLKKQEKDLAMALADRGLVNMTDHFLPRRK